MSHNYGIDYWSNSNFIIEDGKVKINYGRQDALIDIVKKIRDDGHKGPILLRFPHLIKKQIRLLFASFERAMKEFEYNAKFKAVFPLKVNQFPAFVNNVKEMATTHNYGLEAGSKAELIIAMSHTNIGAPITVNGFKDKEMITLGFIASKLGHDITLTIEGLNELKTIIDVAKELNGPIPKIGIRIRLHSSGIGIWAKSGGINSKFGLTSTEIVKALELMREHDLVDKFTMIHFHIGSQLSDIGPLKKALREAGNMYAELKKLGATNLKAINLGGGLAVEYSQHENNFNRNYTLQEYANDVVFLLKDIAKNKNVEEPDIFTESGRFISAYHAVLVAPVLELFSHEYDQSALRLKEVNPSLVDELYDLYQAMNSKNAQEYLHDSLDHMESLLTLFDLGYIDLVDRSNTEVLVHLIIKKALMLLKDKKNLKELISIQERVQERYLVNFSIFQSLPDYWGLDQRFPVMPLDRLDEIPTRSASLWDITCDSDGEISFSVNNPLFLHDVDVQSEEYFLGFFLVGAYQEILGMVHNLFSHPTEATVSYENDKLVISNIQPSSTILDVLDDIGYETKELERMLKQRIEESEFIDEDERKEILGLLYLYLNENGYLRTVFSED